MITRQQVQSAIATFPQHTTLENADIFTTVLMSMVGQGLLDPDDLSDEVMFRLKMLFALYEAFGFDINASASPLPLGTEVFALAINQYMGQYGRLLKSIYAAAHPTLEGDRDV